MQRPGKILAPLAAQHLVFVEENACVKLVGRAGGRYIDIRPTGKKRLHGAVRKREAEIGALRQIAVPVQKLKKLRRVLNTHGITTQQV